MKIYINNIIISSSINIKKIYKYKNKGKVDDNNYYKIKILIVCILQCNLSFLEPFIIKHNEQIDYNYYKSLKNISYDNFTFLNEYRNILLKIFSRNSHKNITDIDSIYLDYQVSFGNQLIVFNKVLFYCEILKCKKIILRKDNNFI